MKCKVAVAQIDSKVGNLKDNLGHHIEAVDKAIKEKANVILFPELSLSGYTLRDLAWEIALDPHSDPLLNDLKEKSTSISIIAGFVESGSDHGIYNSALFLEDGVIKHIHKKIYPPTYGMFEEGRYFSSGDQVRAFDSKYGRFGVLVCEDLWHMSLPYLLALDGAEAIFTLTASPTRVTGESEKMENAQVNHEQHRVYARLISSYIVFANRVGIEDGVNFWGGSSITSPGGRAIATATYFAEDMIFGTLDSQEVQRARRFSRHFLDEDMDLVLRTLKRIIHNRDKQ
ncbi:MAG: acyltransferase [Ignavibacteriales bacterium]|nr:acyltransferase [Ignavibacteriales bacterium]